MEENDFEKQWRDAFEDAESAPSPLVWQEINTQLNTKKQYKIILRIALVLLLFSFGFLSYYLIPKSGSSTITESKVGGLNLEQKTHQITKSERYENETKEFLEEKGQESSKSSANKNSNSFETNAQQDNTQQNRISKPKVILISNETTSGRVENTAIILNENTFANQPEDLDAMKNSNSSDYSKENTFIDLLLANPFVISNNLIEDILQKNQFESTNTATITKKSNSVASPWKLGFFINFSSFTPIYKANYQNYLQAYSEAHDLDNLNTQDFFDALQEKNKSNTSIGLRLNLDYQFSRKISLRSGLIFQNNQFTQESNAVFHNLNTNERYAFINNMLSQNFSNTNLAKTIHNHPDYQANTLDLKSLNNGNVYKIKNTFQYLSVPLQVGYHLGNHRKINYLIFGGVSTDIFLSHKIQQADLSENSEQSFQKHASFKSIAWSGLLSAALQYSLSPNLSLDLEATHRFGLTPYMQPDDMLRFQPRQTSISAGLQYKF